jgi:hypothetical protein
MHGSRFRFQVPVPVSLYRCIAVSLFSSSREHIDNISKKINQRIGLIRRIKFLLPIQARLTLYNSLVLPLLDYSDIVWGDKNNSTLMNHLPVLQHNAARLILDLPRHSSATEALEILEWKPLYIRRKYHRCISVFKCLNHL